MSLALRLELARSQIPIGGEIRLTLALTNETGAPVEVASLFDNNTVTNYAIADADDHPLALVNHVTRQTLLEKIEPQVGTWRPLALPPGAAQSRDDNLSRYWWPPKPGRYILRGVYQWQTHNIISAPVALEVLPCPLLGYDAQWSYHYAEKFLLHSAWVTEGSGGKGELFLRESARFRPQVLNYNPSLGPNLESVPPRVSFNRSLIASPIVWLAWLERSYVRIAPTASGQIQGGTPRIPISLHRARWCAPPLTSQLGELHLVVTGFDDATVQRVLIVRLDSKGREEARLDLPLEWKSDDLRGVCDTGGNLHLLGSTANEELHHIAIDLATLKGDLTSHLVWRSQDMITGIFTPPVFLDDAFFSVLLRHLEGGRETHSLAWIDAFGSDNPLKIEPLSMTDTAGFRVYSSDADRTGNPFALVGLKDNLAYLNGALMQIVPIAPASDLLREEPLHLLINHRGDAFWVANYKPYGLCETMIHRGRDEDLFDERTPQ